MLSVSHLSRTFFLLAGPSASSCRLGWLMYSTVRLKKEFHTWHTHHRQKQQLVVIVKLNKSHEFHWEILNILGFYSVVSSPKRPLLLEHTPWNQNRPLRSSCAAPETGTVLSLRWFCRRQTSHHTVSLPHEAAAKNRRNNLQHERHLQSGIIWRESDLIVGCASLPSRGQWQGDRGGKADSLTS